jgi:hypothetical protein
MRHHPPPPSKMPRGAPRVARRGISGALIGLWLWLTTMTTMTRKQTALAWGASRQPCTVASARRGRRQTTSRDFLRRPARTTCDCDMVKNFMTSGSLTRGRQLEEDPGGSDTTSFPREDAVMTVNDGRPLRGGTTCLT